MGLFKSVIADARPAKSLGQPVHASVALSGQSLLSQNGKNKANDSGGNDSGLNTSVQATYNSAIPEHLATHGQSAPGKPGLFHFFNEQRELQGRNEADFGVNKRDEPTSDAVQNNLATGPIQEFGKQHTQQTPDIDQSTVESVYETKQPRPDLPVFTVTEQTITPPNSPADIQPSVDRKAFLPQELGEITDDEKFTAKPIEDRGIANDTATMTIERDISLDNLADKNIHSVETDSRAHRFNERKSAFHTEDQQLSDTEDRHEPQQAVAERYFSTSHQPLEKQTDPQTEIKVSAQPDVQQLQNHRDEPTIAPNDLSGRATQQSPVSTMPSEQQRIKTLSPPPPKSDQEAELRKLSSTMRQQHEEQLSSIEKQIGLIEARAISLIDEQLARHHAGEQHNRTTPSFTAARNAEVKIGRIDVFVEKSAPASATVGRATRPAVSLASRHYLRRL